MLRLSLKAISLLLITSIIAIVISLQFKIVRAEPMLLFQQQRFSDFSLWIPTLNRSIVLAEAESDFDTGLLLNSSWSPNGEQFAFVVYERRGLGGETGDDTINTYDLYLTDAYARTHTRLIDNIEHPELTNVIWTPIIQWSPDGQYIAYLRGNVTVPHLWVSTTDGQIIGESHSDEDGELPLNGVPVWSEDSQTLYILSLRENLNVQEMSLDADARLSDVRSIDLPSEFITLESMLPSPIGAEVLMFDIIADSAWIMNIDTGTIEAIPEMDSLLNLVALQWSQDGSRIGWGRRIGTDFKIYTLTLADRTITEYQLPRAFPNTFGFSLWLPENPRQTILRLATGEVCMTTGALVMDCSRPDVFASDVFGIRP